LNGQRTARILYALADFIEEDLMRFAKLMLGVVGVGTMATTAVVGCSSTNNGGGTGATATTTALCAPKPSCLAADKTCLGLVDNSGKTKLGLRMAELDVTSPKALTSGIVKTTVAGNVTPNNKACNLDGAATFSWLLQFDTAAGTLKTGGAKPVTDATKGYSFDDEMITQGAKTFHVQPITLMAKPDAMGAFSITAGQDLIVPIFLNDTGTSVVLLPLHQARLVSGTLSSNNNCIGTYNAVGLDPANSCQPDDTHPQFTDAGKLDGYITLEEADTVIVSAISQSLCVLLSGNASMYGMTPAGTTNAVCKRDAGNKILYQGGWCAGTNAAAAAGCADAEQLTGNFAANSVLINN
jgi:hypothetical protein